MRREQKIVYCAMNVTTNKSYIGWCTDFGERKARHIRESELGSKTRFHNALRKYGACSFEWSILFENLTSQDDCKAMERRMIALFDTYTNGYNSTLGGDGGFTGHNSGQFKKGNKPWSTGKKLHYIDKLKNADRSMQYRPVNQLGDNGELIMQWPSMKHAEWHFKKKGLYKVFSDTFPHNKTFAGFKWTLK